LEAADDGDDGDAELLQALETLTDVYQPRKPNEWQQYVEWKEQKEAAAAKAEEAELSRKRAAERLNDVDDDEDEQHSKRQQRSFHYAYKPPTTESDEASESRERPSGLTSPPAPAVVVAAPLVEKQAMLAVTSGEDAYMRRLRMSSQPTASAVNHAANTATSNQPRRPSPTAAALPLITLPLPPPPPPRLVQPDASLSSPSPVVQSRVILLTVAYYCLLTQHCTARPLLPPHLPPASLPPVPHLGCVR